MKFAKLDVSRGDYNIEDYCYGVLAHRGLAWDYCGDSIYPMIIELSDEVYHWLTSIVGHGNRKGLHVPGCEWFWDQNVSGFSPDEGYIFETWFYFKDPRTAILFEALWS